MFDALMAGPDKVEEFLAGRGSRHVVHVPEGVDAESIQDIMVSRSHRKEKGRPVAKVKASLIASGRLR
jgi:hypothetical protein